MAEDSRINVRLRTENNVFYIEQVDAPGGDVVERILNYPKVGIRYTDLSDTGGAPVAANDGVSFQKFTKNDEEFSLPGSNTVNIPSNTKFLRTNLLNGDDTDAIFADMDALNTYLSANTGNFSQPGGAGLAEGDAVKVDADENLVYGDATVDPILLNWTFDQTPSVASVGLVSLNPGSTVEIFSVANLDLNIPGVVSTAAGVSTVTGPLTLPWKAPTVADHTFVVVAPNGQLNFTGSDTANVSHVHTGAGTFVTGTGTFRVLTGMRLISVAGATLLNLEGAGTGSFEVERSLLAGWAGGTFNNGIFFINLASLFDLQSGFVVNNPVALNAVNTGVLFTVSPFAGDLFTINANNNFASIQFNHVQGFFAPGASTINLSSQINNNALISVNTSANTGGDLFKQTTTANINIDSVADNSPATGTITEMQDNLAGGTTIFSTTPYFNGETVTMTGTTSYNQTVKTFNVVAGVSFDVPIPFNGDDAAGSVDSFRLELTSPVAHGVLAGNTIKVINSTFYNNFYTALAVPGNTIIINADITEAGADSFEVQDNPGLDQTDPRVLSKNNPGFIDSNSIAFAHIEDNIALTTIAAEDTYQDINVTGSTGDIDSIDDNGGGLAEITTSAAHGLIVNQNVKQRNTTGLYNGEFRIIEIVNASVYVIDEPYNGFSRGQWDAKLQPGCNMEGFKIVNQNICELEYIKKESFRGTVELITAADKQGNAEPFIWNMAVNNAILNGSPKVPTTITGNTSSPPPLNFPIDLVQGDRIKPQVAPVGTGNTDNLTHRIVSLSTKS